MAETMNGLKRTSYCGKLSKANVGNSEVVCGCCLLYTSDAADE